MGRKPIQKTRSIMKELSSDDRERVRKFAERLAEDTSTAKGTTPGNGGPGVYDTEDARRAEEPNENVPSYAEAGRGDTSP
jgi:hypothetical protein